MTIINKYYFSFLFNIKLESEIQFTHGFDVNAQDTMYHSALKLELKNGHIVKNGLRNWKYNKNWTLKSKI